MASEKRLDLINRGELLDSEYLVSMDGALGYVVDSEIVRRAKRVDAVEVVRCKDCIYATAQDGDLYCDGPIGIFGTVGANDFCSCGERREGE